MSDVMACACTFTFFEPLAGTMLVFVLEPDADEFMLGIVISTGEDFYLAGFFFVWLATDPVNVLPDSWHPAAAPQQWTAETSDGLVDVKTEWACIIPTGVQYLKWGMRIHKFIYIHNFLGGGFKHLLFSPLLGEMIPLVLYGLQPPTSFRFISRNRCFDVYRFEWQCFESLCSGIQGLPVSTTFAIDHCIESTHTPSISYVVEMIITKQVTIHSRRGTLLRWNTVVNLFARQDFSDKHSQRKEFAG